MNVVNPIFYHPWYDMVWPQLAKNIYFRFIFHRIYHIDCHDILYKPMKSYEIYESPWKFIGTPWKKNTILGQVLTLINGDRISMPPMVRLLFEVGGPSTSLSSNRLTSWNGFLAAGFPWISHKKMGKQHGDFCWVSLSHFPGVSKSKKFGPKWVKTC